MSRTPFLALLLLLAPFVTGPPKLPPPLLLLVLLEERTPYAPSPGSAEFCQSAGDATRDLTAPNVSYRMLL